MYLTKLLDYFIVENCIFSILNFEKKNVPKKGLNILRDQLAPPTSWDKIYKWMLGSARVVIIVVEIVVMLAFAVRIVVDTEGGNLDKEITSKQAELSAYKSQELNFREVQIKADKYRVLWESSSNLSVYMSYINDLLSDTSGEISVRIENDEITIRGLLPLNEINAIESALKGAADSSNETSIINLRSVELAEINTRGGGLEGLGEFLIRANIIIPEIKRTL
jgi:hypothetical protein